MRLIIDAEYIENRKVVSAGTSGKVHVPKNWIGKEVIVVLKDECNKGEE